jgi:Zn-dependent peptidase ImmA (M78 family)
LSASPTPNPLLDPGYVANRRRAAKVARSVLAEHDVDPRTTPMEALAHARGVVVREAPLQGAQATLVRARDRAIIVVAEGLGLRRRRFVIAHELGHFELHAAVSFLGLCTGDAVPLAGAGPFEDEASTFASEALMPRSLALPLVTGEAASWDLVKDLADGFRVSLTAAALRFVGLSDRPVALVYVRDGRVVWAKRSFRFRHSIARGAAVWARSTVLHAEPAWPDARTRVPGHAWIEGIEGAAASASVIEHAFRLPVSGGAMALLEVES